MPYEGEFAGYAPLRRIVESERVRSLLKNTHTISTGHTGPTLAPQKPPDPKRELPDIIVAIDGSHAEVAVINGYPGAKIGYCTVASVFVFLGKLDLLDAERPVDPRLFRETEEASTIDAALPGSNVVTTPHATARDSFRDCLYKTLNDVVRDEATKISVLDTYEDLLTRKPQGKQKCPYLPDCEETLVVGNGVQFCSCPHKRAIYSTDALRIHEGFRDVGSNGEVYGEVMQVWERVLLVHLLKMIEQKFLSEVGRVAFIMDGPLAVFGHPAWLSAAIKAELTRINTAARKTTGHDLVILGIEKSGEAVTHFEETDKSESPGEVRFAPRTYALLTDSYIKQRIIFSDSAKRYGLDTYFGRKFFYKTASEARSVATLPFLSDVQDTLDSDDVSLYPEFGTACALLDKLVSSRYANALAPVVSAHSHAAIPLHLGAKVLEQLAKALVKKG